MAPEGMLPNQLNIEFTGDSLWPFLMGKMADSAVPESVLTSPLGGFCPSSRFDLALSHVPAQFVPAYC